MRINPQINASLSNTYHGRVIVDSNATGAYQDVAFAIPMPGVLYGQPVKVEEVTIYYDSTSTYTYIDETRVYRQRNTTHLDYYTMGTLLTNQNSVNYTSYSVPMDSDNVLSAEEGMVTVHIKIYFDYSDERVTIGGVRVRLGHHPLY